MQNYYIPKKYKKMIDLNFLQYFQYELHLMFGLSLNDFRDTGPLSNQGTAGWHDCFVKTCINFNKNELLNYYESLDWYQSDLFDDELADMFIQYKISLDKSILDLILEKLRYEENEIFQCHVCGKYYPIDFLSLEEPRYNCCHHCKKNIIKS